MLTRSKDVNDAPPAPGASARAVAPRIHAKSAALGEHPILTSVTSLPRLRVLMGAHVYSVWAAMSLVKRLQHELTSLSVPWVPPACPVAARLINEIVSGAECDLSADGTPVSHYELCLEAMQDIGADTQPVRTFVAQVDDGSPLSLTRAFAAAHTPAHVQAYVTQVLRTARQGALPQVLGAYLGTGGGSLHAALADAIGRWSTSSHDAPRLAWYLERHLKLECGRHAEAAERVVDDFIASSERRADEVAEAASESMRMRVRLWDGVLAEMRSAG